MLSRLCRGDSSRVLWVAVVEGQHSEFVRPLSVTRTARVTPLVRDEHRNDVDGQRIRDPHERSRIETSAYAAIGVS